MSNLLIELFWLKRLIYMNINQWKHEAFLLVDRNIQIVYHCHTQLYVLFLNLRVSKLSFITVKARTELHGLMKTP